MKKIVPAFVIICQFVSGSSEIFNPMGEGLNSSAGYSMPEVFATTSLAVLYRVRKAGKYFIIKTPKDTSARSLAMLKREYELSIGRQHPNVVNVFTFEESTVVGPGIVMEYVDGRTLTAFLAENPTPAMRRRVFEQLLQAVAYIHRSGIVHNDIKPENILVTRADNDVRLIDFGLADDDAHYLARTLGCTPAYASPELLMQEKSVDARSDIYSLGVIMREIFGNRYLRIAGRCLCAQKEKRYADAEQLLAAFRRSCGSVKDVVVALCALFLFALLLNYGVAWMEERRRLVERDTMISHIEQNVEAIYSVTVDSIMQEQYYEFAINHIISFYEKMGEYQMKNVSSVTEPELSSVLSAEYMKKLNSCQEILWQKTGELPSFYKCGLPLAAVLYYDSLVSHRLPFVPFR